MPTTPFTNAAEYLAEICAKNRPAIIDWPDAIPAAHAGPSATLSRELTLPSPALRSKKTLHSSSPLAPVSQQAHKPEEDKSYVFCYLAPRSKPDDGGCPRVLFLFAERRRDHGSQDAVARCARPFDSGGLKRDSCFRDIWRDDQLKGLIQMLTFRHGWRRDFEIWVAHMFPSLEAYMHGELPAESEPLGLNRSDRWNFTWELLIEQTLPLSGRLVAVMDIRSPRNGSSLGEGALRAINKRQRDGRIAFRITENASSLDKEVYALFKSASILPGW